MRLLLVDDEERFVSALAKRLRLRGYEADIAFRGEDALGMLIPGTYALVVLDVKMPGIGGVKLMKKMRTIDRDLRFIFFTGHGADVSLEFGEGERAIVLAKPLDMIELLESTRATLEQGGGREL
jgi:DNA-binding response OmpR family regulator